MKRSNIMASFDTKTKSNVYEQVVTKKRKHANKEKLRRGDLNTSYGELMGLLMQIDPEVGGNVGDTDNSKKCIPTVVPVENLLPRRALINRAVAMITSLHEKNTNLRSMVQGPVAEEETTTTCGELPQEHPDCDTNCSRISDPMPLSNSNFQTPNHAEMTQYEPKQNNNSHRIDSLSVLNPPATSSVLLQEHQNHDESYFRMPELTVSSNSIYESRRHGRFSQCEPMQNNSPHQMNSLSILGQYLQQVQALNTRSDMLEKQLSSDLPITNTKYVNENRCYEPQYNNGTSQAYTAILHALALQQQN